ncbi:4'-phosphopantetheinyl transferase [Streptomyces sp. NBC_00083]|uniref:4'-phosphopantetheinyl transferase family protein n=1 Tax=Streptomyces sp. NBC_00083 TaxID=2975647 RepID=UPI00225AFC49|nr:4'-phosphopantetheinyl transferase superfamily protein [Streptomyces sp. NBC_00083]MCX5384775.1 4'-phosphopantetheinyl transferase superfamily protein [Streptomyces sp. NBC_00083]
MRTEAAEALLRAVLPPRAVGAARADDVPGPLFAAERELCAGAGPRREGEFTTGRWCAHRALARLGELPVAVGRGPRGEPVWPHGVLGSITHCPGFRAAALCRADDAWALGIDAEVDAPLPPRVRERLISADEAGRMRPEVAGERLLFSAKEAAYKACSALVGDGRLSPLAGLRIFVEPGEHGPGAAGRFRARIPAVNGLRGADTYRFEGRWQRSHGLVVTSCVVVRSGTEVPTTRPRRVVGTPLGPQTRSAWDSST